MNTVQQHRGVDRGQIVPIAACMMLAMAVIILAIAQLGRHASDAALARTAADAAALAGAAAGRSQAELTISANRATLVSYVDNYEWVEVIVLVGQTQATARAERIRRLVPHGSSNVVVPALQVARNRPIVQKVADDPTSETRQKLGPLVAKSVGSGRDDLFDDSANRDVTYDETMADFSLLTNVAPAHTTTGVVFPDVYGASSVAPHGLDVVDRGRGVTTGSLLVGYEVVASDQPVHARRVRRTVRRIEVMSALKVSFVLYLCMYGASLISGLILWRVAHDAGVVKTVERFVKSSTTSTNFHVHGRAVFQAFALGGLFAVALLTLLTAAGVLLFNLISDLVGGIRLTILEEEVVRNDRDE